MNWNQNYAQVAAQQEAARQAFQRQIDEANRQRAYLDVDPWSPVAVEAYRGVVIDGEARRKVAASEARMGE